MSEIDMNSVLLQMRAMAAKARGIQAPTVKHNGSTDFTTLMKTAVDKVNETQQNAAAMAKAFESGSKEVDLSPSDGISSKSECRVSGRDSGSESPGLCLRGHHEYADIGRTGTHAWGGFRNIR